MIGILINCDLCFIEDFLIKILDVMMKDNLIIVLVGMILDEVEVIF